MAEYIEREALISDLEDVIANYKDGHAFLTDYASTIVIDILNNIVKCQPAADVAPVVRCKECATVTYEEFLKFKPCWLEYEDGAERIKAYFDRYGGRMSALDILNLDDVSAVNKLWSVLREEFIPAPILHEFACVCAECALTLIDNPDPRSIKAIEVKRAWIRGEATNEELETARYAADAARDAARYAADAARDAARYAADAARDAARDAAMAAARVAAWSVNDDVYEAQVAYLIMTLEEEV